MKHSFLSPLTLCDTYTLSVSAYSKPQITAVAVAIAAADFEFSLCCLLPFWLLWYWWRGEVSISVLGNGVGDFDLGFSSVSVSCWSAKKDRMSKNVIIEVPVSSWRCMDWNMS
ncbi:hypothetical protein Droror1_Dr00008705, partial [Drosera rotundifolia]